jgi:DNA-3-methyladenine glycosylase
LELKPLPRAFFDRDPRRVARDLLGKLLIRRGPAEPRAGRIVEVEAYLAADDPAAHAFRGPTARNRVLFGPPGHAYVYFIYGNHYCLNVSCLGESEAGCVLIRALEPVSGMRAMARARGVPIAECTVLEARPLALRKLTSGPGRLCDALGITRPRDNGKDLTARASDLIIADDRFRPRAIATTPRIGIVKAADRELRFVIAGSEFLSGKNPKPKRG